jgi:hypothetical protein
MRRGDYNWGVNHKRRVREMTIEQMRNVLNAKPFAPFIIHLADGRQVAVLSREFVALDRFLIGGLFQ